MRPRWGREVFGNLALLLTSVIASIRSRLGFTLDNVGHISNVNLGPKLTSLGQWFAGLPPELQGRSSGGDRRDSQGEPVKDAPYLLREKLFLERG